MTGLLRGLIKNAKFPKDLALVYTSRRVVYREMTFPEMPLAELHDTLPFQVKNYIALPVDDSIIDFVPLTREEQAQGAVLHCMVVATLHTGVERTTTAIQNAGFAVRSVDVGAFSLARIFRDQSRDKAIAVVNVGSNSTDVIVLLQGHPVALRAVPSGADDITQAVAKALDILFEGALEIKNRISLQNVVGDERLEKAEEIIRDTTAQLIVGIRNTLNMYNTDPGNGGRRYRPGRSGLHARRLPTRARQLRQQDRHHRRPLHPLHRRRGRQAAEHQRPRTRICGGPRACTRKEATMSAFSKGSHSGKGEKSAPRRQDKNNDQKDGKKGKGTSSTSTCPASASPRRLASSPRPTSGA